VIRGGGGGAGTGQICSRETPHTERSAGPYDRAVPHADENFFFGAVAILSGA
jgi:hypothetical protein